MNIVTTVVDDIEGFIETIEEDIKGIIAKAEAVEDPIIKEIIAAVNAVEALVKTNPLSVVLQSIIPEGSAIAGLIESVGADILAGVTWIEGLLKQAPAPDQPAVLVNKDAVVATAITKLASVSETQLQGSLTDYGNQLLIAASPKDGNISYASANLAKAIYAKVA